MMHAIAYYLSVPVLYLLSLLPFWLLYRLSDLLFLVLFHLVGYRKQVVLTNLRNAFPERGEAEIRDLARRFYRHLCDLLVETVKLITIGPRALRRRMVCVDRSAVEQAGAGKQSLVYVLGHFGNWEMMALAEADRSAIPFYGIYRPLKNKYFDRFIQRVRSRYGMRLLPMRATLRAMVAHRDRVTATAFMADQAPPPDTAIWTTFLHQDTPVFAGPEKIARKFHYPVLFATTRKVGRGYYQYAFELISASPEKEAPEEITRRHVRRLEEQIQQDPSLWLWSHRRWKHERPAGRP